MPVLSVVDCLKTSKNAKTYGLKRQKPVFSPSVLFLKARILEFTHKKSIFAVLMGIFGQKYRSKDRIYPSETVFCLLMGSFRQNFSFRARKMPIRDTKTVFLWVNTNKRTKTGTKKAINYPSKKQN